MSYDRLRVIPHLPTAAAERVWSFPARPVASKYLWSFPGRSQIVTGRPQVVRSLTDGLWSSPGCPVAHRSSLVVPRLSGRQQTVSVGAPGFSQLVSGYSSPPTLAGCGDVA